MGEDLGTEVTSGWPLVALGLFLLAGYLAKEVGRRAHVPRVTLLLLLDQVVASSWFAARPRMGSATGSHSSPNLP